MAPICPHTEATNLHERSSSRFKKHTPASGSVVGVDPRQIGVELRRADLRGVRESNAVQRRGPVGLEAARVVRRRSLGAVQEADAQLEPFADERAVRAARTEGVYQVSITTSVNHPRPAHGHVGFPKDFRNSFLLQMWQK